MIWFWFVGLLGLVLVVSLYALRRYEQQSAVAARREVSALRDTVQNLEHRIEMLEAIATSTEGTLDVEPEDRPAASDRTPPQGRSRAS